MTSTARQWLNCEPASAEVLRELQATVGRLPGAYLDLLRQGNGGEVVLRVQPCALCLDSAESALNYWRSGTYPVEGLFIFGGNGGGSLLALDLRSPEQLPVVHFDPIDPEGSMAVVASDFEGLLALCEAA